MSIYKGDKIIAGVSGGGGGGDIPADIADQLAKKENKSNKVTTVDSTATDVQYPSAKAVNDSLVNKEDKSNKITVIDPNFATASDVHYPSEKAVVRVIDQAIGGLVAHEINEKEDKSNKVTTVDSTATDVQYPSAKAVNDSLVNKEDKSNKVTVINSTATDDQYPSAKAVNDAITSIGILDWSNAVSISNDKMKTTDGYVAPNDGWFVCSGVAPADGDSTPKEIFIDNKRVAFGTRGSSNIDCGSASCPIKQGDVIKTSTDAFMHQLCYLVPYK